MMTTYSCADSNKYIVDYVDGALSPDEKTLFDAHLTSCVACSKMLSRFRATHSLMQRSIDPITLNASFAEQTNRRLQTNKAIASETFLDDDKKSTSLIDNWQTRLGGAPWWGVSIALHILVILLAGLISMSLEMPTAEDAVVIVTELQPAAVIKAIAPEKPKNDNRAVLESKHDTPPTDPNSTDPSNIVVPPEILAIAEVGDHFETINLDRPDTHSAFGNPESHIFYDKHGNDEPEGGGGQGGCSLDNLIGVGGNASPGSGGGWGGGHGPGIGVGTGAGKGSWGFRIGGGRKIMVQRHNGSKATEAGVNFGLEWLARNQEADGHWDNQKHGGRTTVLAGGDAAMTGFALLAFLGAGHTEKVGKYKEHVIKGVKWLIDNQNKDGRWGGAQEYNYAQGIATMALGEAYAMARMPATKKAAQLAVDAVDKAQIQNGPSDREAWDYYPGGLISDSSIMAWNILALKSCKIGGLSVNPVAFDGCLNWLNAGQDLGKHQPLDIDPYYEGGLMIYRGTCANPLQFGGERSTTLTAAAGLCRMMIGGASGDTVGVAGPCNLILKNHIPTQYPFNMYFGYYATLLMFQKGGDHWNAWNEAMKKALTTGQCKGGGPNDGSWNPIERYTDDGSRVMSTALCILCLEVYYRYAKLAPGNTIKN